MLSQQKDNKNCTGTSVHASLSGSPVVDRVSARTSTYTTVSHKKVHCSVRGCFDSLKLRAASEIAAISKWAPRANISGSRDL